MHRRQRLANAAAARLSRERVSGRPGAWGRVSQRGVSRRLELTRQGSPLAAPRCPPGGDKDPRLTSFGSASPPVPLTEACWSGRPLSPAPRRDAGAPRLPTSPEEARPAVGSCHETFRHGRPRRPAHVPGAVTLGRTDSQPDGQKHQRQKGTVGWGPSPCLRLVLPSLALPSATGSCPRAPSGRVDMTGVSEDRWGWGLPCPGTRLDTAPMVAVRGPRALL